jgi:ketosteroid isomerase-like protein
VVAAFEGYADLLGAGVLGTEQVLDAGDQVVALIRTGGTSQGADVPWDHVWGYLCRVRDGQLVYLRAYWDPQEALAAAGVS